MNCSFNPAGAFRPWLLRAALALLVGLSFPAAPAWATTLNMVCVGVSTFKDDYAPKLASPTKDALGVAKTFKAQKGTMFTEVTSTHLLNEQATAANITKALKGLHDKAKEDTYTLLFVASHGGTNDGVYSFCAYDQLVPWPSVQAALKGLPGKAIVVLDTCGAGGVKIGGNLIVFSASLSYQTSFENSAHGCFTSAFLAGLSGKADANNDGKVTLAELDAYLSNQLEKYNKGSPPQEIQQCTLLRPPDVPSSMAISMGTNAPLEVKTLSGTSWVGTETLAGYGKLTFVFGPDGKLTMTDAQPKTYTGSWTQSGGKIDIKLSGIDTQYAGSVDGAVLSGKGQDDQGASWDFKVSRIKSLANSSWDGTQTVKGLENIKFDIGADGKLAFSNNLIVDGVNGTWTQNGAEIEIKLPGLEMTYRGNVDGTVFSGQGETKLGKCDFKVTRLKMKNLANTTWEGEETLTGFGKLTFAFAPEGKVTMSDAQGGTYKGTWKEEGATFTIHLPDIDTTYTAALKGTTLSGEGISGLEGTWKFSVGWVD